MLALFCAMLFRRSCKTDLKGLGKERQNLYKYIQITYQDYQPDKHCKDDPAACPPPRNAASELTPPSFLISPTAKGAGASHRSRLSKVERRVKEEVKEKGDMLMLRGGTTVTR